MIRGGTGRRSASSVAKGRPSARTQRRAAASAKPHEDITKRLHRRHPRRHGLGRRRRFHAPLRVGLRGLVARARAAGRRSISSRALTLADSAAADRHRVARRSPIAAAGIVQRSRVACRRSAQRARRLHATPRMPCTSNCSRAAPGLKLLHTVDETLRQLAIAGVHAVGILSTSGTQGCWSHGRDKALDPTILTHGNGSATPGGS